MVGGASKNGSRRGSKDPGWKYCHSLVEGDTMTTVCNYCDKITTGGITRAKEHLMGKKGNVTPCLYCPKIVKEELWGYVTNKKKKSRVHQPNDRDFELPPTECDESENDQCEDSNIDATHEKEAKDRVHQCIARFWYEAGLSFDLMKLKSFEEMVVALGAHGKHLNVSTYHDIIVPLVKEMKDHKEQRKEPIMYTRGKREKRKVPSSWGALTAFVFQTSKKEAVNTSSKGEEVVMLNFDGSTNGEKVVQPVNETKERDDHLMDVAPTKPIVQFVYSRRKKGVNQEGRQPAMVSEDIRG